MMILARMIHVLETAITKAKFVSNRISTEQQNFNIFKNKCIYRRGKYSPLVNDFAEKQFRHV